MRSRRLFNLVLAWFGGIVILVGVCVGCYTSFILRPKVKAFSVELSNGLATLESTSESLRNHAPLIFDTLNAMQTGTQMIGVLPETLTSLRGTLIEASGLLHASSVTTREMKEGITGLVLPDAELSASVVLMRKTAMQLRLLSDMLDQVRVSSLSLATQSSKIFYDLNHLAESLTSLNQSLVTVQTHLRKIRHAIDHSSLPTQVTLLGIGFGCLYVGLGASLLVLSRISESMDYLRESLERPSTLPPSEKRAA